MTINQNYINEYKKLIQTTDLQKGYQEFIKFFRFLRTYLEKELSGYTFTGNIVENNMDYSYFQFTNALLKSKGLKIVIAFVHKDFCYEVWLSGMNRSIQNEYFIKLKENPNKYILTTDPNRIDYILKKKITDNCDYNDLERLMDDMKMSITGFVEDIMNIV